MKRVAAFLVSALILLTLNGCYVYTNEPPSGGSVGPADTSSYPPSGAVGPAETSPPPAGAVGPARRY